MSRTRDRSRWRPRILALGFGLLLSSTIVGISEGLARWREGREPPGLAWESSEPIKAPHPILGYAHRAGVRARVTARAGDQVAWEVHYSIDEFGRRVVPRPDGARRDRHLLFLGGSVTFGEGVEDEETLPAQVATRTLRHRAYNFGVAGYGPQHALMQLRDLDPREIEEPIGLAVFTFIDPHLERVAGCMRMFVGWGEGFPCFEIEDGKLVHRGSFEDARPGPSRLYRSLMGSALVRRSALDLPELGGDHTDLLVRILIEARHEYRRKFPAGEFVVLLFPTAKAHRHAILPGLRQSEVRVVDHAELLDPDPGRHSLHAMDPHPAPEAYRLVAEALVTSLRLDLK